MSKPSTSACRFFHISKQPLIERRSPLRVESGATLVEYVILLVLVAAVLIILGQTLLQDSQDFYDDRTNSLNYMNRQPLVIPTP